MKKYIFVINILFAIFSFSLNADPIKTNSVAKPISNSVEIYRSPGLPAIPRVSGPYQDKHPPFNASEFFENILILTHENNNQSMAKAFERLFMVKLPGTGPTYGLEHNKDWYMDVLITTNNDSVLQLDIRWDSIGDPYTFGSPKQGECVSLENVRMGLLREGWALKHVGSISPFDNEMYAKTDRTYQKKLKFEISADALCVNRINVSYLLK